MKDTVRTVKVKNKYIPINYMNRYYDGERYKKPTAKQKIYELPLLKYEDGTKIRDIIDYCNEYSVEMFLVGNRLNRQNCSDEWIVSWVNACYQYNQFIDYFDDCIELIRTIQEGIQNKLETIGATYRKNDMMMKVVSRSLSYRMSVLGYLSPNIDTLMLDKILRDYYLLYMRKQNNVDCIKYNYTNEDKKNYCNKNSELRDIADNISLEEKITFFTNSRISDSIRENLSFNKKNKEVK